jgi:hypothetical protein
MCDEQGQIAHEITHYCNHCGNVLTQEDVLDQSITNKGTTTFVRRAFLTLRFFSFRRMLPF